MLVLDVCVIYDRLFMLILVSLVLVFWTFCFLLSLHQSPFSVVVVFADLFGL